MRFIRFLLITDGLRSGGTADFLNQCGGILGIRCRSVLRRLRYAASSRFHARRFGLFEELVWKREIPNRIRPAGSSVFAIGVTQVIAARHAQGHPSCSDCGPRAALLSYSLQAPCYLWSQLSPVPLSYRPGACFRAKFLFGDGVAVSWSSLSTPSLSIREIPDEIISSGLVLACPRMSVMNIFSPSW